MGTAINAICKNCGFEKNWMEYGVGFKRRTPAIPAQKVDTQELVLAEYTDDPNLKFYHQKDMYKGKINGAGIQCFDICLSHKNNLCPKCGNYTMEFEEVGEWD